MTTITVMCIRKHHRVLINGIRNVYKYGQSVNQDVDNFFMVYNSITTYPSLYMRVLSFIARGISQKDTIIIFVLEVLF